MVKQDPFGADPGAWLRRNTPDAPVFFFRPATLQATAQRFLRGFPGAVTYAVKANPAPCVLDNLVAAGLRTFDVASVPEMQAVRAACPDAALHFHNPVRSRAEIAEGLRLGVQSWSVDRLSELDKLAALPPGSEIAVRLKLPVPGAAYDFGAKFGAEPEAAAALLQAVADRGLTPSMTFHPGTQCDAPDVWERYIAACAGIAARAGVRVHRLNTGGGFAAHRGTGPAPDLETVFARIDASAKAAFAGDPPPLVCEPGRAMVAEAFCLALRVKAAEPGRITLNDGLYGALGEWRDLPAGGRIAVLDPAGKTRTGPAHPVRVFGPTCDSLDQLPASLPLPADLAEEDWLLIDGMGAYSGALVTDFNGFGARRIVTL